MQKTDAILSTLEQVLESRKQSSPSESYVSQLHHKGLNKILEKIGEEATEVILAAKDGEPTEIVAETADLWFHSMVMLSHLDIPINDVLKELNRRTGTSGHTEKANRPKT